MEQEIANNFIRLCESNNLSEIINEINKFKSIKYFKHLKNGLFTSSISGKDKHGQFQEICYIYTPYIYEDNLARLKIKKIYENGKVFNYLFNEKNLIEKTISTISRDYYKTLKVD